MYSTIVVLIGVIALLLPLSFKGVIELIRHFSYIRRLNKTSIGLHVEYITPDKSIMLIKMGITQMYICTKERAQGMRQVISDTGVTVLDEGEFEIDGLTYFRISELTKIEYINYINENEK